MSATPHVELCKTAAHLRDCGECADEIEGIVKNALQALTLPQLDDPEPGTLNEDGFPLITSHADVPNAVDHPADKADECGICIKAKRQPGQRPQTPAAILTQLESL